MGKEQSWNLVWVAFSLLWVQMQAVAFVHVVEHKTAQTDLPNIEIQKGHIC